jgi:hypothetical protein
MWQASQNRLPSNSKQYFMLLLSVTLSLNHLQATTTLFSSSLWIPLHNHHSALGISQSSLRQFSCWELPSQAQNSNYNNSLEPHVSILMSSVSRLLHFSECSHSTKAYWKYYFHRVKCFFLPFVFPFKRHCRILGVQSAAGTCGTCVLWAVLCEEHVFVRQCLSTHRLLCYLENHIGSVLRSCIKDKAPETFHEWNALTVYTDCIDKEVYIEYHFS